MRDRSLVQQAMVYRYTNAKQLVWLRRSDVTNHAGLQVTFDEIVKDFGRIDGL